MSPTLLAALGEGGPLHPLVQRTLADPRTDLHLRRDPGGARSTVTLYFGLTKLLDVSERNGELSLSAHATHQAAGGFDPSWSARRSLPDVAATWGAVERYLDHATVRVDARHLSKEGVVQASLGRRDAGAWRVADREWSPHFLDEAHRRTTLATLGAPLIDAVARAGRAQPWWPGVRSRGAWPSLGTELDLLAVAENGDLLAIEVKSAEATGGLTWSPVQVAVYARLLALWFEATPHAGQIANDMLAQRIQLGLVAPGGAVAADPAIVPVVALGGPQHSPVVRERMRAIADAIEPCPRPDRLAPLQVWHVDAEGRILERWR